MRLRDLKMSLKINSLVLMMALFMGAIGFTGYIFYHKQNTAINIMSSSSLAAVKYLNQANADIRTTEALSLEMLLAPIEQIRKQQIINSIENTDESIDALLNLYSSMARSSYETYETDRLAKIKDALSKFRNERQKAFALLEQDSAAPTHNAAAYVYYANNAAADLDSIHIVMTDLIAFNSQETEKTIAQNNLDFHQASGILLFLPVLAVLLALILGSLVARLIANPLQAMLTSVQLVAQGNLVVQPLNFRSKDEVGQLAVAFNRMTANLRNLVSQLSRSSQSVTESAEELQAITLENADAATQISTTMAAAASETEQQTTAVNETSVAIEQMSAGAQQIAATSQIVKSLAEKAALTTQDGKQALDNTISQMAVISERTGQVHQAITNLTLSNQQIREITTFISGIAAETNLLALNAAIEAARVGEQGRGFAVVASEVRKLAEQSQEASLQINALIRQNQDNLDAAVAAMNAAANDVHAGISVVGGAGLAFTQITGHVDEVLDQITEISTNIQQVAQSNQQLVSAIHLISGFSSATSERIQTVTHTTMQQAASSALMAQASQALSEIAQNLQASVREFTV